jgi:hypothetical protein
MKAYAIALAVVVAATGTASPQTGAADAERSKAAQFLRLGFKDGRERLRSGVYRAHGRKADDSAEGGKLEGPVDYFCAFDYPNELLRFDQTEVERVVRDGPAADGSKRAWVAEPRGGKFARTPKRSLQAIHGEKNPAVYVYPSGHEPPGGVRPLDVRSLGLAFASRLEITFAEARTIIGQPPLEVTKETKQVTRLTIEYEEGLVRYVVWFDEGKGFAPIRMERRTRKPNGARWETQCVAETTWIEKGGVWVPKAYRIEDKVFADRTISYELAFDWEAVNEPLPTKLFTPEGFGLPKGSLIFNNELNKPFIEGAIGGGPVRALLGPTDTDAPPQPERTRVLSVVFGLGSLVAVSVVWFGWYRYQRRAKDRRPVA